MTVEELKKKIEDNTVDDSFLIFKYKKNRFICEQYYREIAKIKNLDILVLDDVPKNTKNLFSQPQMNLTIVFVDEFNDTVQPNNTIVICHKTNQDCIEFPELENWQILDYALSNTEGVSENNIKELCEQANYNIYRIDNEINKINIFEQPIRQTIFNSILQENQFIDLSNKSIFDLSTAIQNKDFLTIKNILLKISAIDIEPIGLLTVLINTFRKMIDVWLLPNPTEKSTGLSSKQIWAIKNLRRTYTKDELIYIYQFLCDLDVKIKTGYISTDILIDYMIINILGVHR